MRRLMMVALSMVTSLTPAFGADCEIIQVEQWTAEVVPNESFAPLRISTTLANTGDRAFRMVDGGTRFTDALGRSIVLIKIDPDLTLAPGETASFEGFYLGGESERLASLSPSDVTAEACVRSILYDDGERADFQ